MYIIRFNNGSLQGPFEYAKDARTALLLLDYLLDGKWAAVSLWDHSDKAEIIKR